jgi:hypothetical protein
MLSGKLFQKQTNPALKHPGHSCPNYCTSGKACYIKHQGFYCCVLVLRELLESSGYYPTQFLSVNYSELSSFDKVLKRRNRVILYYLRDSQCSWICEFYFQ